MERWKPQGGGTERWLGGGFGALLGASRTEAVSAYASRMCILLECLGIFPFLAYIRTFYD